MMRLSLLRTLAVLSMVVWLAVAPAGCAPQVVRQVLQGATADTPAPPSSPTATAKPRTGPAAVGQPAPDFSLPTVGGQMTKLSDYRGKVVLVNLWATWCPPCRLEVPELVATYNRYKDSGFTILAINQGEERDQVQAFAGQYGMAFPVLLDTQGRTQSIYPTRGIPASFLVDRQGVVRQIVVGAMDGNQLSRLLEPLLGS